MKYFSLDDLVTQLLREFSIHEVDWSMKENRRNTRKHWQQFEGGSFVIETVQLHFIGGRVCYLISSTEWHHNMLVVNTKIIHH